MSELVHRLSLAYHVIIQHWGNDSLIPDLDPH